MKDKFYNGDRVLTNKIALHENDIEPMKPRIGRVNEISIWNDNLYCVNVFALPMLVPENGFWFSSDGLTLISRKAKKR